MTRNPRRAARGTHVDGSVPPSSSPSSARRAWEHSPLAPVSARPPLPEYLNQLWDRRHFISLHARSQALGQHEGTFLGRAWLVVGPLMDGLVYWLIFGVAFQLQRTIPDFIPRLLVGILLFSYFARGLNATANSLAAGRGLIKAFSFPRASLPIAAILRESISAVPMVITLLVMILVAAPGTWPTSTWLLLPFPLLLIGLFIAGAGFFMARIISIVPDVSKLLGYILRFALYGSGVIFSVERFSDHPTVAAMLTSNPIYIFIEMARDLLLYDTIPAPARWLLLTAWSISFLVLGLIYFWRGEADYGKQRVA